MDNWRKRLGAVLMAARDQEKKWNRAEAAGRAELDRGVIVRIERGENTEVDSLERYALTLGKPLEEWLRDILIAQETHRPAAPSSAADESRFHATAASAPKSGRRR